MLSPAVRYSIALTANMRQGRFFWIFKLEIDCLKGRVYPEIVKIKAFKRMCLAVCPGILNTETETRHYLCNRLCI